MASCQTPQWSTQYTPYVLLTVTESSSTATTSTLSYTLDYVVPISAAQTGAARPYHITINGSKVKEGTYDINGVGKGTHRITSGTTSINKTTSSQTISFGVSFDFNLSWTGVWGGTKTASGSITIPAKTSYTITYNANGGSGAPSSQTKWHGTNVSISSTKPTRTGYTFQGWALTSTGSVLYAPGETCTRNENLTLYAIWKANTYTISYNANGGSGAPSSQTKTYGVTLILSNTKPTRTRYTFKGWGTSSSATTVSYAAGANYTANAGITLYAIWELSYVKPRITNFSVTRCNSSGTASETGTYIKATFNWATDISVQEIWIDWSTDSNWTTYSNISASASGTSGSVTKIFGNGNIDVETTYYVRIFVYDGQDSSHSNTLGIGTINFPIDVKKGGNGVAIGKVSEEANVFDVAYYSKFRKDIEIIGDIIKNGAYFKAHRGYTADMDTAITHGYYNVNPETVGGPNGIDGYGILEVIESRGLTWNVSNNSSWIWQIYRDTNGNEYHRHGVNSSTMSSWKKVTTTSI